MKNRDASEQQAISICFWTKPGRWDVGLDLFVEAEVK